MENEHRIRQAARNIKNNIVIIMTIEKVGIGLVGLGTVGSGIVEIIEKKKIFSKKILWNFLLKVSLQKEKKKDLLISINLLGFKTS